MSGVAERFTSIGRESKRRAANAFERTTSAEVGPAFEIGPDVADIGRHEEQLGRLRGALSAAIEGDASPPSPESPWRRPGRVSLGPVGVGAGSVTLAPAWDELATPEGVDGAVPEEVEDHAVGLFDSRGGSSAEGRIPLGMSLVDWAAPTFCKEALCLALPDNHKIRMSFKNRITSAEAQKHQESTTQAAFSEVVLSFPRGILRTKTYPTTSLAF